ATLDQIYLPTRHETDSSTNVTLFMRRFPTPPCNRQGLDPQIGELALANTAPAPSAIPTIVNTDLDDTLYPRLWDRDRYGYGTPYPGLSELLHAEGQSW